MTDLASIVDHADLTRAISDRLIAVRAAADGQVIYNYTDTAMYTPGAWDNPAVRACRGLIVAPDGTVVARPWPKFFNYGQAEAGTLDLDARVSVTDKMDGSLGILHYGQDGRPRVATRGSFTSDQAIHATRVLHGRYAGIAWPPDVTPLVEIVYPSNRVVCDYGALDDLILLGGVRVDTGDYLGAVEMADLMGWTGPVVDAMPYETLRDALAAPPRHGKEGMCVRYLDAKPPVIVKIKQSDYVELHRIVTGLSERVVWRHMAVRACKDIIADPRHWGTYLGVAVADAEKSLSLGDDWLAGLIDAGRVPDEVLGWLRGTVARIGRNVADLMGEGESLAAGVADLPPREQAEQLRSSRLITEVLILARRGDPDPLTRRVWREVRPDHTIAPFYRGEDAA